MRKGVIKTILYGILIWIVPFVVAAFLWDVENNQPRIGIEWFSAFMAFVWAVTYAIVICLYSKGVKWDAREGWRVGLIWYLTIIVLELVFIVGVFSTPFSEVSHLFITDSPTLIVTVGLGYAASKMKR